MTVGKDDPEIRRAEAEIARARDAVATKVMALQHELARTFDWRAWVAARPYSAVGAALLVGAILGRWHGPLFPKPR
jgi:ElaB/YqjD/DUF883 family membrane-anchored ribosome-binding protein